MSAITPKYETGPITVTVVEAVTGGQLVEGRSNGCGVAAAGSLVVLGVAQKDATNATPATTDSYPLEPTCPVLVRGVARVTYANAATFGQKLIAAANGQVTPAGTTPDARTIVGTCWEPAGVSGSAVGLMKIGH